MIAAGSRTAAIAIVAFAAFAGPLAAEGQDAASAPLVPTVAAQPSAVGIGLELDGMLQAVRQSTVAAQASGNIVQLLVRAGDAVRAGQVLARIDERDAQAGLASSEAALARSQAELANARAHYERSRQLRAQGFISQAALDVAEAQFRAAQAGQQQAQAGRSQAALARSFANVVAPYDGLVLATHVEAGDLAAPGRALVSVYAPQPMRAVAYVPASRQVLARQAQRIQVRLPSGQWITPSASTALPGADPVSQTVEFRLELPAGALAGAVPGQSVRVRFAGGSAERLTVPAAALLRRGELTGVYVARERGFVLQAVRIGAEHGEAGVELLAGLKAGERIALDPVRAGLAGARPAPADAAR
ncbi:MAG: efflux RND transporter periplasmic adaptor subunit [Burkholderiaceae bacterium]|nr:efflux RND transporter periplasmic adaptor subunit [Burkholderiaceae bacterium]